MELCVTKMVRESVESKEERFIYARVDSSGRS